MNKHLRSLLILAVFLSGTALSVCAQENGKTIVPGNGRAYSQTVGNGLVQAAQSGDIAKVRSFLKKGPDTRSIDIALLQSVWNSNRTGKTYWIVKLLLAKGANPNAKEEDGTTVLMNGVRGNYCNGGTAAVVKLLINRRANIDARNRLGRTALQLAASCPDNETVKFLLAQGAKVNERDNDGETALMAAAGNYDTATIVQTLLSNGADVNARTRYGRTALIMAAMQQSGRSFGQLAQSGDPAANVKLLLDNGADPTAAEDNGLTALEAAQVFGNSAAVLLLIERLAKGK